MKENSEELQMTLEELSAFLLSLEGSFDVTVYFVGEEEESE